MERTDAVLPFAVASTTAACEVGVRRARSSCEAAKASALRRARSTPASYPVASTLTRTTVSLDIRQFRHFGLNDGINSVRRLLFLCLVPGPQERCCGRIRLSEFEKSAVKRLLAPRHDVRSQLARDRYLLIVGNEDRVAQRAGHM